MQIITWKYQKQPPRGVLKKRCSESMQQICSRTPMPKCNLNKVARQKSLRHGCSPVNLLHIFRTPFFKNISGWLLLRYNIRGAILRSAFAVASYKGGWRGVGRGAFLPCTAAIYKFYCNSYLVL